ncbi:MAG: hypothetical protein KDG54_19530, partial [Geminicoccaceae bacterium]|nr:hypothetical protein [Geminicoccaceae bacterium]
ALAAKLRSASKAADRRQSTSSSVAPIGASPEGRSPADTGDRSRAPRAAIDVSGLWGAVEGYVIGALESPRASISTPARHFGFDAIETEGVIRFVMRGRASVATLAIHLVEQMLRCGPSNQPFAAGAIGSEVRVARA